MRKPFFRWGDLIIYLIVIVILLGGLFLIHGKSSGEAILRVQVGRESYFYPMSQYGRLSFQGKLGETVLLVDEDGVRVVLSPCSGGDCMRGEPLNRVGQWRACLPNEIIISIEGKENSEVVVDEALF